jgi:antitoxin HicB
MTENGRSIDDYLKLPYTVEITKDEGENYSGWFARVVELPGCMTQADTLEELEFMIEDAKRAWITTALEDGEMIPEPASSQTYSGKFVVRVPKSLHRDLAEAAEREGVSLNTFVNTALSRAIGAHLAIAESKRPYRTRKNDVS